MIIRNRLVPWLEKIWNVAIENKKEWLKPVIFLVIIFGLIIALAKGVEIVPISYTTF
tara:strand:+ start:1001 stop:1171 length:171 start_codon:yes stop_codon:yes gene_type:complete